MENSEKEVLTYDLWLEKYKPVKNHLCEHAGFDGMMFETYSHELDFVRSQPVKRIWTICDEGDNLYIVPGFWQINRLGYFITEEAYDLTNAPEAFDVITAAEKAELAASQAELQDMPAPKSFKRVACFGRYREEALAIYLQDEIHLKDNETIDNLTLKYFKDEEDPNGGWWKLEYDMGDADAIRAQKTEVEFTQENQHSHYDMAWWQDEAFDSCTVLGYNEWVHHQLEADEPRERPVEYLAPLEDEQEAGTEFDPENATIPELLEYCEEHSIIAEDDEERLDPNYWLGDRMALVDNVRSHMNGDFDTESDNSIQIIEAERPE